MLMRNLLVTAAPLALAGSIFVAFLGYSYHREINYKDCGLGLDEARAKVETELLRRGLPAAYLEHEYSRGSCMHFFGYRNEDSHFSYSVQSTWLHGVKLGRYDYSRENQATH